MTTVRERFVLCTPEGEFLHIGSISTMTGYRASVVTVDSIDDATVVQYPNIRLACMQDPAGAIKKISQEFPGTRFIPVKVTRSIEITGFSVPL